VHESVHKAFRSRLSAHDPLVRSSSRHQPTQRTFDKRSSWRGACVHIGRGNERADLRPASPTNGTACESTGSMCTGVSTYPPLCRYSEHTHQKSSRFLSQPCVLAQGCKDPPRVNSNFSRNHPPAPRSVLWFQHGLETDLITFFRLHPVEPAAGCHESLLIFYQILVGAGGIGRDDLIEPQLQRNHMPRTRTTRPINGEIS
jgi:hypothetical protein